MLKAEQKPCWRQDEVVAEYKSEWKRERERESWKVVEVEKSRMRVRRIDKRKTCTIATSWYQTNKTDAVKFA